MSTSISKEAEDIVFIPKFVHFTKAVHHAPYDKISPLRPELSARGKNVVVTGGGTGIGKAIATGFAQAGAKSVSILGRREDRLKTAVTELAAAATDPASTFHYKSVDLAKHEELNKALAEIVAKVGNLHILVPNAAALPTLGPVTTLTPENVMNAFAVNTLLAFNAVKGFLAHAVPDATILNISSGIAHMAPIPGLGGHGMSKAANVKMMDSLAAENPRLHIVNVQPGAVQTEMTKPTGVKGEDSPDLPGHFCVWLASPEAKFLRGKFVWSNWDVDEMMARAAEIKNSKLLNILLEGVPM